MNKNKKYEDWLKNLKEGDIVAIDLGKYTYDDYLLTTVRRITPSGFIKTENGYVFNPDGTERSNLFESRKKLVEPIKEVVLFINKKQILMNLKSIRLEDLPAEFLEEVFMLIKAIRDKESQNEG